MAKAKIKESESCDEINKTQVVMISNDETKRRYTLQIEIDDRKIAKALFYRVMKSKKKTKQATALEGAIVVTLIEP